MDALELLGKWPDWARANAERVLASPAWRLRSDYDGSPCEVTARADEGSDFLWLEVVFDDEKHLLGVSDSTLFPELHLLWEKRRSLPVEILLALAERECGPLFQLLENAVNRTFSLKGVVTGPEEGGPRPRFFSVKQEGADEPILCFALTLSSMLKMSFGRLKNLDVRHAAIRDMTIPATAEYFQLDLSAAESEQLKVGDFLLCETVPTGTWRYDQKPAPGLWVIDAQVGQLTFGQIADDALPPVPAPQTLKIVKDGVTLAEGVFDRVVETPAIRIVHVENKG